MSARLSNVQRACFALLGTFVVFAPSITSGCGTSTAPPASDTEGDAAIHYGSVVTYGGGDGKKVPPAGPGASGSATGSSSGDTTGSSGDDSESGTPPGSGDDTESGTVSGSSGDSTSGTGSGSSGSSVSGTGVASSGTSASGSSSGTSSGSHAMPDSGMEGGSSGSMAADAAPPPPGICDDYVVTNCGTSPCDLRSNTCCVTLAFATRCLKGTNAKCNTNEATLHCSNGCECTGGTSCCGVSNTIAGAIQSECQNVPNGGNCQPYPSTTTMASAQFCKADSQCKNGQGCITQTCTYSGVSATFDICGLQAGCKKD
jgi:hypothetical protein